MKVVNYLLLAFIVTACAEKAASKNDITCIQFTDRNGFSETISSPERLEKFKGNDFLTSQPYKQVFRMFGKNESGQPFGILTSYHPNGQIFQYLEVINSRANGVYKEWHFNGELKVEAKVVGGSADLSEGAQKQWLFDDRCSAFDESGKLLSEMFYKKGLLDGDAIYYYPNGKVKKVIPYSQNEVTGDLVEYYEDGKLHYKTHFKGGKLDGASLILWEDEKLASVEEYKDDLLLKGQYFNKKGEIVGEVTDGKGKKACFENGYIAKIMEYRNGVAEGRVEELSSNGELKTRYFLKGGEKNGEESEYYPLCDEKEQIKKLSFNWDSGIINGLVKTFYPNGKLESQKEIKKNKRDGISCAWYKNGRVMFVEEYEDDLLVNGKYYKNSNNEPTSSISNGNGLVTLFDGDGAFLNKIKYAKGVAQE